jgi:hypothetical protein
MSQSVNATTSDLLAVIRQFKQLGAAGLDDAFEDTHLAVARIIEGRAKAIARATGDRAAAEASKSIEAKPSTRAALVKQGSQAEPWQLGALFGSIHDLDRVRSDGRRVKGWNQFLPAKEGGYSVYPAIDAESDRTTSIYAAAVERIIGKALDAS